MVLLSKCLRYQINGHASNLLFIHFWLDQIQLKVKNKKKPAQFARKMNYISIVLFHQAHVNENIIRLGCIEFVFESRFLFSFRRYMKRRLQQMWAMAIQLRRTFFIRAHINHWLMNKIFYIPFGFLGLSDFRSYFTFEPEHFKNGIHLLKSMINNVSLSIIGYFTLACEYIQISE